MEEVQALRSLTEALQNLELLESFERDCGKFLSDEIPTVNFCESSGHTGYRLASEKMGEVLLGELPKLLRKSIENQKVVVEERRIILRDTRP